MFQPCRKTYCLEVDTQAQREATLRLSGTGICGDRYKEERGTQYMVLYSQKQQAAVTEYWHFYLFIYYSLFNITFNISNQGPIVSNGITSCE